MNILIFSFATFKKVSIPLVSKRLEIIWLLLWDDLRRAPHFPDDVVTSLNIETFPIIPPEEKIVLCVFNYYDQEINQKMHLWHG